MLKIVKLRAQLDEARTAAASHKASRPDFVSRRAALDKRKADAEKRVDEMADETADEELNATEAEVAAIEAEGAALNAEEAAFDAEAFEAEQGRLDAAVTDLERQIAEIENGQRRTENTKNTAREEGLSMYKYRSAALATREAREKFFTSDTSKAFLERFKAQGEENRAVSNVGKVIPAEWLDVLREELPGVSKLLKYVRYAKLKGDGRQPITTAIPEAVWIDAVDALNEATLGFGDVEYDCYALGAYIAIPNLYLKSDSLVDLGNEIMIGLINACGVGCDKAILYGTNTKMPLGVVTRLAQTSDPSDQSINYPWADLHSSNVFTVSSDRKGADFFRELANAKKALKKKGYPAPHGIVWCMNSSTHAAVDAEAIYANVLAVGTAADGTDYMPVLKGVVEELDFIPDNNIVVGYFDFYGFVEREGAEFGYSEHPFYLKNRTVFKGVMYADGMPLVPAAFAVIGIGSTSPTTTGLSFAPDYANLDVNVLTVTAAAHGSTSGKTVLTVSGKAAEANTLKYKVGLEQPAVGTTPDNTWESLTSGSTGITAAAGTWITVAELDASGKVVGVGFVTSVPKA